MAGTSPVVKRWELWEGTHRFHLDGRFMFARDYVRGLFTSCALSSLVITWCVCIGPIIEALATLVGLLLYIATMYLFISAWATEPGILPSGRGSFLSVQQVGERAKESRTCDVDGQAVPLKWCRTCHIFRPPRASHCSRCDVCIDRFDHHCYYMGTCIGGRNYREFVYFMHAMCVLGTYMFATAAITTYRMMVRHDAGDVACVSLLQDPSRPWVQHALCFLTRLSTYCPINPLWILFVGGWTFCMWMCN